MRHVPVMLLLLLSGCGPQWEVRNETDMLRIDAKRADVLREIRVAPHYTPQVTDRGSWLVHTSFGHGDLIADGDASTSAVSLAAARGAWILVDLGSTCFFQNVRQIHSDAAAHPPRYRVDTAGEQGFPFTLQYVGTGSGGQSVATFPDAVQARFVRITVVEDGNSPWSVAEIEFD